MAIPIEVGGSFVPDLGSEQLWFGFVLAIITIIVSWCLWRMIRIEIGRNQEAKQRQYERHLEDLRREIKAEVLSELAPDEDIPADER